MNKKAMLSSIMALVICISMIAGSTFALFTSEATTDIVVSSGTVKVSATVTDLALHSQENIDLDTNIGTPIEVEGTVFPNGGSAAYANGTLTLTNITPGDGVTFNISVTNSSNVAIKYRVVISDAEGGSLNGLVLRINNVDYTGTAVNGAWTALSAGASISSIPVSIELPTTAKDTHQGKTTKLSVTVEAVQGNTYTVTPVPVSPASSGDLAEAFEEAESVAIVGGSITDAPLDIPEGKELIVEDVMLDTSEQFGFGISAGKDSSLIINDGNITAFYMAQVIDAQAGGATVTLNGGSFDGNYLVFIGQDSQVVINNCTFATPALPATVIAAQDDDSDNSSITINGGTFYTESISDNPIHISISGGTFYTERITDPRTASSLRHFFHITGGTFSVNPTEFLADGYTATQNGDGMWTVSAE